MTFTCFVDFFSGERYLFCFDFGKNRTVRNHPSTNLGRPFRNRIKGKICHLLSLAVSPNVWRNFVTFKKTYLATVNNSRVRDQPEALSRAVLRV